MTTLNVPAPNDNPSQKRALRSSKAARKVRATFPAGTRVESIIRGGTLGTPWEKPLGVFGTVQRHVPGTDALGGYLVVRWDSGTIGRSMCTSLRVVKS